MSHGTIYNVNVPWSAGHHVKLEEEWDVGQEAEHPGQRDLHPDQPVRLIALGGGGGDPCSRTEDVVAADIADHLKPEMRTTSKWKKRFIIMGSLVTKTGS